jgi:PAS domain S-box-containing protein
MQSAFLNMVKLGFLFLLFATMLRGRHSRRLRFWTAGWLLVVVNASLPLFQTFHHPAVPHLLQMIHLQLLLLTGTFFLLSFLEGSASWEKIVSVGMAVSVPTSMLACVVSFYPGSRWAIALCVVAGQALALAQTRYLSGDPRGPRRIGVLVACWAMGGLILAIVPYHPGKTPEMMIAELMLATAVLCWTGLRRAGETCFRRTSGTMIACGGLVVWAVFFPLSMLLVRMLTDSMLATVFWNLPRFLVGFGMLMMLHEEDLARAKDLSEQYRLLFDRHPLPMWVFHVETLRFLMVNEAAVAHYGYTREQFAAMTIRDIRPAADLERLREVVEKNTGELKRTAGWQHILSDGRQIAVDIFSHAIVFEQQPARIVVALDVTQRNAAEEKLRQAYKLESLGQLTGGIAHDFNNILAIILGSLELIEQRSRLDAPSQQMVRQAIASVHRGSELTGRLLAYARKQPLEPRIVSIPGLLDETVSFIQSSLGPMVEVRVLCDPLLWQAQIDPGQLENALLNLAVNARDAMGESGMLEMMGRNLHLAEPVAGLLGEIGAGDYIVLSVSDNGSGMPEEVIQRATEPFFTTKPVGKGTGLGLSMVYGFLKQSGGHMQIESRVGEGTTVHLYLPRAMETERRAVPRAPGGPMAALPRGEELILVVEDEHAIRQVLVYLLQSLGYRVLEAEDGPGALKHLKGDDCIDLLLTDVVLPNGISGGLLAADAKEMRPEIKVLFSSGYTRNVLIRDRRLEEGVHLLTKPFRLAELATTVRRVLDVD